jgi:flagellar basal-body rod protein FlgF
MIRVSILFFILLFETFDVYASSNAFYITLSNQIARRRQLEVVANNTANTNTIGFEADSVLFNKYDIKESKYKKNTFVLDTATYRSEDQGALQRTNRPLDIAIISEDCYFKVQTPRGNRFTLNGSLFVNNQGIVVNGKGYPYLSPDNQPIVLPENIVQFQISQDGLFFVEGEEVGQIGVFLIPEKYALIKESDGLARSKAPDILAEEYMILDNTLRMSNVNPTKAMTQMVELQRSIGMTSTLMSDLNDIQKSALQKISR